MLQYNAMRMQAAGEGTLFSLGRVTTFCSALRTTLSTSGLPSSVLHGPAK